MVKHYVKVDEIKTMIGLKLEEGLEYNQEMILYFKELSNGSLWFRISYDDGIYWDGNILNVFKGEKFFRFKLEQINKIEIYECDWIE